MAERTERRPLYRMTDSVRRSRTRLLAASDEVRRQLERDLHDGAQQDLVAVQFRTVMARGAADPNGVERELDAIDRHAGAALDELRALAQGVYPSVLRNLGVGAALHVLAKRSSLPVQVSDMGINAALINMRDRIAAVGGELAIHSALGRGTSVYARSPTPNAARGRAHARPSGMTARSGLGGFTAAPGTARSQRWRR